MTTRIKLLTMCALFLATAVFAAGTIAFSDQATWTSAQAWGWHPMDTETYMENYLLAMRTDEGAFLFCTFMVSNAGFGDHTPGAGIAFYTPAGAVISHDFKFNRKELTASTAGLDMRMGDLRLVKSGEQVRLVVPRGPVALDLTVTPTAPLWRRQSGRMLLGNEKDVWNWAGLVARGRVAGKITFNGKTYDAAGLGYLDHTWSNKAFFDYSKNWLSTRIHGKKWTVNFVQMKTKDDKFVRTLMLARDGAAAQTAGAVNFQLLGQAKKEGYMHPTAFELRGQAGTAQVTVTMRNGRYTEVVDPIRSLSAFERKAIQLLVAKPVLLRMQMDTTITVTENGTTESETLPAVASMLYFAD